MSGSVLILIVDDNLANLKLAAEVLEFAGYKTLCARDAVSARTILGGTQPDLILMDIQLPKLDGLAFARELKNNPVTSSIPIVALTAFAMKGDEEKARMAGCSDYITKPIDTRRLPEQVARCLAAQSPPSAASP